MEILRYVEAKQQGREEENLALGFINAMAHNAPKELENYAKRLREERQFEAAKKRGGKAAVMTEVFRSYGVKVIPLKKKVT